MSKRIFDSNELLGLTIEQVVFDSDCLVLRLSDNSYFWVSVEYSPYDEYSQLSESEYINHAKLKSLGLISGEEFNKRIAEEEKRNAIIAEKKERDAYERLKEKYEK